MWQQKTALQEQREMLWDAIRENDLEADAIFACGPAPMLRAIKAYALEKGDSVLDLHGRAYGLWT